MKHYSLLLALIVCVSISTSVAAESRPFKNSSSSAKTFETSRIKPLIMKYREVYSKEIEEGNTCVEQCSEERKNPFEIRLEKAINGVWRYPKEAAEKRLGGIVTMRIGFNRRGEITNLQQLESSGSKILDEEVLRTLRTIKPVKLPTWYDKEEFYLIKFFQYGRI